MSTPGPWHEVEYNGTRFRFGFAAGQRGPVVQGWHRMHGWLPLTHDHQVAFRLGYHARRSLVASLVEQERER